MKQFAALIFACLFAVSLRSEAGDYVTQKESPHAQAIRLVTELRVDEIRKLDDPSGWWHDTKERVWSVKRPFGPGGIDSTHYFLVTYSIDGTVVGRWYVNTRSGQVAGSGETLQIEGPGA